MDWEHKRSEHRPDRFDESRTHERIRKDFDAALLDTLRGIPAERKHSLLIAHTSAETGDELEIECDKQTIVGGPEDGTLEQCRLYACVTHDGQQTIYGGRADRSSAHTRSLGDEDRVRATDSRLDVLLHELSAEYGELDSTRVYNYLRGLCGSAASISKLVLDSPGELAKTVNLLLSQPVLQPSIETRRSFSFTHANRSRISGLWFDEAPTLLNAIERQNREAASNDSFPYQSITVRDANGAKYLYTRFFVGGCLKADGTFYTGDEAWLEELSIQYADEPWTPEKWDEERASGNIQPTVEKMSLMTNALRAT